MDLTVFIPTRGRTDYTSISFEEISKFSDVRPVIVCPRNEVAHYDRVVASEARWTKREPCKVLGLDDSLHGIGPTRQAILELSQTRGVMMIDDDMYFSRREDPEVGGALVRCTDLRPLFQWVSDTLDAGYAHGGVSARQGNNHMHRANVDCTRVNNVHFFDREVFLGEGTRFDALPVMEDFHVTLSLLLKGYPNRVAYHHCWSQRGSGFKGGCSLYRTPEVQAQAAEELHRQFPQFVKVVEKESASQHGAMAVRKDVNIQWLKAWDARTPVTRQFLSYVPATPDTTRSK